MLFVHSWKKFVWSTYFVQGECILDAGASVGELPIRGGAYVTHGHQSNHHPNVWWNLPWPGEVKEDFLEEAALTEL